MKTQKDKSGEVFFVVCSIILSLIVIGLVVENSYLEYELEQERLETLNCSWVNLIIKGDNITIYENGKEFMSNPLENGGIGFWVNTCSELKDLRKIGEKRT